MSKREIFETVDEGGNAIGQYFTTWIEAHVAALEMGLGVRRATIDVGCSYTLIDRDPQEPQEWTLETILPESEM